MRRPDRQPTNANVHSSPAPAPRLLTTSVHKSSPHSNLHQRRPSSKTTHMYKWGSLSKPQSQPTTLHTTKHTGKNREESPSHRQPNPSANPSPSPPHSSPNSDAPLSALPLPHPSPLKYARKQHQLSNLLSSASLSQSVRLSMVSCSAATKRSMCC